VIRKLALLIILVGGFWAADGHRNLAQVPAGSEKSRCASWYMIPTDRPGTRRYAYPFQLKPDRKLRGWFSNDDGRLMAGYFVSRHDTTIAIWSEPDGTLIDRPLFTAERDVRMDFEPDDDPNIAYSDVITGRLAALPAERPKALVCAAELSRDDRAPPRLGDLGAGVPAPPTRNPEPKLGDIPNKLNKGPERPAPANPVKKGFSESDPPRPAEGIPGEPGSGKPAPGEPGPGKPATGEPTPGKPAVVRRDAPPGPQSVCRIDTFQPVPVLHEVTDRQMVGWRNSKKEGEAYDYLSAVGDAIGFDAVADLTTSVDKVVPYEAVGKILPNEALGRKSPSVWVSMKYGGLRWKPSHKKSTPSLPVRVIVAGGAPEIAMSGLDAVGAELRKQSSGRATVTVEWYQPTETGSLGPVQRYDSIEDFVRAADEHKGDGRPVPLGEIEIRAFLDSLQSILIEQTQPFDRVFWIKGGYMVPSAVPARFEEFIESVARKSAPVRGLGSWLTVVTANMPGFSIGYLQAPVYSKSVGDVIVQPQYSGTTPPRYITDAKVLAARLFASASTRAAAASAADAGPAPSGKLVFDAKDIFVQRGYVLSLDALAALRAHLGTIETMWNGGAPSHAVFADLARKTGRPSATLIDLLQHAGGTPLLPLPKGLPDWSRRPLDKLDEGERGEAAALVKRYREGIGVVEDTWQRQRESRDPGCGLVYVPEEQFGFQ
jgi:hypothetical protein